MSAEEQEAWDRLKFVWTKGIGYGFQLGLRPQTMYGQADSPIGLAAYFLDHDQRSYRLIARVFDGASEGLTKDDILDNITITWLTNTFVSGAKFYWENKAGFFDIKDVKVPTAISSFPDELYPVPRSWAEKAYPEADPLQPRAQGRPLRRMGAAEGFVEELACGLALVADLRLSRR